MSYAVSRQPIFGAFGEGSRERGQRFRVLGPADDIALVEVRPHLKAVFILGSGFSADVAGFPTLRALSLESFKSVQAEPPSPLQDYLVNHTPYATHDDLEVMLTYLGQQYPWRDEEESHLAQGAFVKVVRSIRSCLDDHDQLLSATSWADKPVAKLIGYWHRHRPTVITFNYDTLIERIAEDLLYNLISVEDRMDGANFAFLNRLVVTVQQEAPGLPNVQRPVIGFDDKMKELTVKLPNRSWPRDDLVTCLKAYGAVPIAHAQQDLADARIQAALDRLSRRIHAEDLYQIPVNHVAGRTASLLASEKADTFALLKLHGSMNWYFSGNSSFAGDQVYYSPVTGRSGPRRTLLLADRNTRDLVPLIVPPVLDKSAFYFNNSMRAQWGMAKRALESASDVFVVGYSLPSTDLSTAFLLQAALRTSSARVTVLNRSTDDSENERRRYLRTVSNSDGRLVYRSLPADRSSVAELLSILPEISDAG